MLPSSPYGNVTKSRHSSPAESRTRIVVELSAGFITIASRTSNDSSSVPQPSTPPGFSVSRVSSPVASVHRYMSN